MLGRHALRFIEAAQGKHALTRKDGSGEQHATGKTDFAGKKTGDGGPLGSVYTYDRAQSEGQHNQSEVEDADGAEQYYSRHFLYFGAHCLESRLKDEI